MVNFIFSDPKVKVDIFKDWKLKFIDGVKDNFDGSGL